MTPPTMMIRTTTPAMILFVVMAVEIRGTIRANAMFISTVPSLRFRACGRQRRPDPLGRGDRLGHGARLFGGEIFGATKRGISPPGHEPGVKVGDSAHGRE